MRPRLLAYPGNEALATPLCRALHADPVGFEMRDFPDGETYLRIGSDVQDQAVAILCTLREPDRRLLPLMFMADTLRDLGVRHVGLIAPYLAYMRQDRRFHAGEAVTSSSFARLLSAQFDWLVTVDPHLHRRHSLAEIYTIPTEVVHATPLLTEWIRVHVQNPLVVGPDAESEQWVRQVAEAVPCPYVVLDKVREGDRDVVVSVVPEIRRWADRTPVLVDDIISSAATLSATVRQWIEAGLAGPVCLGVHGVFAAHAYETLQAAGAARIVTTNSIPHASNDIDISPALVEPVRLFLSAEPIRARRAGSLEP
jgi:ribose-phosphate pyrophosphokinase